MRSQKNQVCFKIRWRTGVNNILSLLLLSVVFVINSYAQEITIKLWEEEPPLSIRCPEYREREWYNESGVRYAAVIEPTITIYLPQKQEIPTTAVLIIPGGGYAHIAYTKEGEVIARWLNQQGIAAAVLKYRLPSDSIISDKTIAPLLDAQQAMRLLRKRSNEWNISKVGVMGFSAGGHLAATLCTHYNLIHPAVSDTGNARPDFSILIYPVISMDTTITHRGSLLRLLGMQPNGEQLRAFSNELNVTSDTPPSFIVHAMDDAVVPIEHSLRYWNALRDTGVQTELHIFQRGGHGFGLALDNNQTNELWPQLCIRWLTMNGWK